VKFDYDPRLLALLADIEGYLIANTPTAIANLKVAEPAYTVFLWYDDSSTRPTQICPSFGVGTTSLRNACAEEFEDDPDSFTNCIWRPNQEMDDELVEGRFKDPTLASRCQDAYRLMWPANTTGNPLAAREDAELLRPFRAMMHRAASRLNEFEWGKTLPTTDDFVVVAVDRIGYWLLEDMAASIPPPKRTVLRERRMFPQANQVAGRPNKALQPRDSRSGRPITRVDLGFRPHVGGTPLGMGRAGRRAERSAGQRLVADVPDRREGLQALGATLSCVQWRGSSHSDFPKPLNSRG
jgi:hypothetical protein